MKVRTSSPLAKIILFPQLATPLATGGINQSLYEIGTIPNKLHAHVGVYGPQDYTKTRLYIYLAKQRLAVMTNRVAGDA